MPDPSLCSQCGDAVPPGAVSGHCPRCLLSLALADEEAEGALDAGREPWTVLGGCELYEEIGRGGMGVVYQARQRDLDRVVAVKVLLQAEFVADSQRERFQREAEAVARLRHPGIVGIHEVGNTDGAPWFSMDYIEGSGLDELTRERPLPDREAAACVRTIAEAVGHAHERSVLHRDLKPSNILIDTVGKPHITDFGIAARLDGPDGETVSALTRTGQSLGSPGYAAPELVLGGAADVRADVYGLGAILYHTLTCRPPHQGASLDAILLQIRDGDPVAPSRLNPGMARDLETICLKCLRKRPESRYPTAVAVAEDLGRFLANRPILARPAGAAERAWRWCQRRPATAALLVAMIALVIVMVGGSIRFATGQRDLERRATLLVEAREIRAAAGSWARSKALGALAEAWRIRPSPELRHEAIASLVTPELRPQPSRPYEAALLEAPDPSRSADGRCVARIEGAEALVTGIATGQVLARLAGHPVGSLLKLNGNATRLASAAPGSGELRVVSLPDGAPLFTCRHPEAVESVDWSLDLIATGCANRFVYIWGEGGALRHRLIGHEARPVIVRFRPRGRELFSIAADKHLRLWQAARGVELLSDATAGNNALPAWWSEDGGAFHFGAGDRSGMRHIEVRWPGAARLLTLPSDEPVPENLQTMDISPSGDLVSTSDDGICRVWSVETGEVVATFPKGPKEWMVTRFSPDGEALWLSGWDRGCVRREIHRGVDGSVRFGPAGEPLFGAGSLLRDISCDGRLLLLGNNQEGAFLVGDLDTGRVTRLAHPSVLSAAFSPDGALAATSSYASKSARVWSLPEGKLLRELAAPNLVTGLHFDGCGKTLLLRTGTGEAEYRLEDWASVDSGPGKAENLNGGAWSRDGLMVASHDGQDVRLLRAETLEELIRLPMPSTVGWMGHPQMAFSAGGARLAVRTAGGSVVVWDLPRLRSELGELGMGW